MTSIHLIWKTLIEQTSNPSVNVCWQYETDAGQRDPTYDTDYESNENEKKKIMDRKDS